MLRSDDLAHAGRDRRDFLNRLRERLADEPVVLAPAPVPAASPCRSRRAWPGAPAALAAGAAVAAGSWPWRACWSACAAPVPQGARAARGGPRRGCQSQQMPGCQAGSPRRRRRASRA
ncbi:hypothetical protein [Piscinibacter sp.]|uniref:hypothetical protein n=1 Tax=Piscinibacter sp. TaxID=1903157 RepID=UPI0025D409C7|nr:hypothetical protein [Piscinibacter sp.]